MVNGNDSKALLKQECRYLNVKKNTCAIIHVSYSTMGLWRNKNRQENKNKKTEVIPFKGKLLLTLLQGG